LPNPRSLISCYPPTELSNLISKNDYNKLRVYVDLKNVMTSLFVEDVANEIVVNSDTMEFMDSSIFQSVVLYASYWKDYANERNLKAEIYFCTDIGRSNYHLNISKDYKCRRVISNTAIPDNDIKLKEIRDKNFQLSEIVSNKIKNVYFFALKFLESDFLPYYLIDRKFNNEPKTLHIITSNDKDLYQNLNLPNTVMIYKNRGTKYMYMKDSILKAYTKVQKGSTKKYAENLEMLSKLDTNHFPAMMSIVGDDGDDVKGVDRIGPMTVMKMFSNKHLVNELIGSIDELNERVHNGGKFFHEDKVPLKNMSNSWQKAVIHNDLVTNAFKLISFEQLCLWMERTGATTYIKYINDVLKKEGVKTIPSAKSFLSSLEMLEDNYLREDNVNNLFGES